MKPNFPMNEIYILPYGKLNLKKKFLKKEIKKDILDYVTGNKRFV